MRTFRTSVLAGAGAVALASALALPGIAAAAAGVDNGGVSFSATDGQDCTATFTIDNATNSGMNKIVYWTGPDAPVNAPPFGDDRGATTALTGDPAAETTAGVPVDPWGEAGYQRDLEPVETTGTVDFSDVANGADSVKVSFRMTGLEADDYDTSMQTVTVTGCSTPSMLGSLGSLDLFGSLEGILP